MTYSRDTVLISSIEWDFLWQSHQDIASRLARSGNRVLYIENTGVRSPGLRDAGRVWSRLKHWARSLRSGGVREVAPNLYVCAPLVLPPFGPGWRRLANRRLLLPLIRRTMRRLGINRDAVLWTYLPSDTAVDLVRGLRTPESVVVYYCIADFSCLTPHVGQLRRSEQEMVTESDLVFANCAPLATHCAQWSPNVHIFPVGINADAFPFEESIAGDAQGSGGDEQPHVPRARTRPAALDNLPQTIIGYVGGLHRHIDFELLTACARARPLWSWVCVGTVQAATGDLAALPNVFLLGRKPHPELVSYIRCFDVCIVPYTHNPYTDTVVPTKIKEYLAVGKPVVSTELPTVRDFNEQHRVLLTARARPDDFLRAIEQALSLPTDAATTARRRTVALKEDWQARLESMSTLIQGALQVKAQQVKER
jgi:glycosyltransferase involved in cell wall biosynthesis